MKPILLLLIFISFFLNVFTQTYTRDYSWLVPEGNKTDSLNFAHDPTHNRVFVSGLGANAQESHPSFLKIDKNSFSPVGNGLEINGEINAVEPDGLGGYFISGTFTKVNGQSRTYLAQLDSNNNLMPFNPLIEFYSWQNIHSLKVSNGKLFVGGSFDSVNGLTRYNLVAFDVSNGQLLNWAPNPSGYIMDIETVNGEIIIGGSFSNISGQLRNNIASFDSSLNLLSWSPITDGDVMNFKKSDDKLYVMGSFTTFNNLPCTNHLIELDTISLVSSIVNLNLNTTNGIYDIEKKGSKLYLAVQFYSLTTGQEIHFCIHDTLTNQNDYSSIVSDSVIRSIFIKDSILYLAGNFSEINTINSRGFARYNLLNQTIVPDELVLNNRVNEMSLSNNHFVLVGTFNCAFKHTVNNLNCFDDSTGQLVTCPLQVNGTISNMSIDGKYLTIIGEMIQVNGLSRNNFAIYDLQNDSLLSFNPSFIYPSAISSSRKVQVIDNTVLYEWGPKILAYPLYNDDSIRTVIEIGQSFSNYNYIGNFFAFDSLLMITGSFSTIFPSDSVRHSFALINWYTGEVLPLQTNPDLTNSSNDFGNIKHSIKWNDKLILSGGYNGLPVKVTVDLATNQISQDSVPYTPYFFDVKHNTLRVSSINYIGNSYYEENLLNDSINQNIGILNNKVKKSVQVGSKIFAYNDNDFGVYNTCEKESITNITSNLCFYTWNGVNYTKPGVYSKSFVLPSGCDSIAYLNIKFPYSENFIEMHVCTDTFTSNLGIQYTTSGLYNEVYTNQYGCDSIVHLKLNFHNINTQTINITSTNFYYNWSEAGLTFSQSGVYTHVFQSIYGCDSIVHLNITFVPNSTVSVSIPGELIYPENYTSLHTVFADEANQKILVGGQFQGYIKKAGLLSKIISQSELEILINKDSVSNSYSAPISVLTNVQKDGIGGFFIQGDFIQIGDSIRDHICRLNPDYSVSNWKKPNGNFFFDVFATDSVNMYVFKQNPFGDYDTLYKINHITGTGTPLNCVKRKIDPLNDMLVVNGSVICGGRFSDEPIWNPFPTGGGYHGIYNYNINLDTTIKIDITEYQNLQLPYVSSLKFDGTRLYAVGSFYSINNAVKGNGARFNINNGNLITNTWDPGANGPINNIEITPTKIIITGDFNSVYTMSSFQFTLSRNGTASFNKSTLALTGFNPGYNLGKPLLYKDQILFNFPLSNITINGELRSFFAAFDTTSFSLSNYILKSSIPIPGLIVNNDELLTYGVSHICFVPTNGLMYYDAQTDIVVDGPIHLPPNTVVYEIFKVGNKFFFNGNNYDSLYTSLMTIFSYDGVNGNFIPFNFPLSSGNRIVGVDQNHLYLSNFSALIGEPNLTRVNLNTLELDSTFEIYLSYNNTNSAAITCMDSDENFFYFGGFFDHANNINVNNLIKVKKSNFQIYSVSDSINQGDFVDYIKIKNNDVFLVYRETQSSNINLLYHTLSKINKHNGQEILKYNTNIEQGYLKGGLVKNDLVYFYGQFDSINSFNRRLFTVFDENLIAPYEISYDSITNSNFYSNVANDIDVIGNDIYGVFAGNYYQVHRVCRNDVSSNVSLSAVNNSAWYDDTITSAGTYYHIISDTSNCDSLMIINVIGYEIDSLILNTSCDNYFWNQTGLNYNVSGIYTDTVYALNGMIETLYLLELNLNYFDTTIVNITACDTFTWVNGLSYSASTNTPIYNMLNANGCDSILNLNLIVQSGSILLENSFVTASDSLNCTGSILFKVDRIPPYEITLDNQNSFQSNDSIGLLLGLCSGLHDLLIIDNCSDTLSYQFSIPTSLTSIFNNPYPGILPNNSLGAVQVNCNLYYNSIDTAYIDTLWMTGNVVTVIWNIVDASGSNLDTTSYVLLDSIGVYFLQLSLFCPNKSNGSSFTVTQAIYFDGVSSSTASVSEIKNSVLTIYPNPTNDRVNFAVSNEYYQSKVLVYDSKGSLIDEFYLKDENSYSLKDLNSGVYYFHFRSNNESVVKRVIKTNN